MYSRSFLDTESTAVVFRTMSNFFTAIVI